MACIPAPSCAAALIQATERWPGRSRATDGICPGPQHSPVNPQFDEHAGGEAFDLTHDPAHGVDTYTLADELRLRADPRVKYIISNRRIWNPLIEPWHWRLYTGSDPHTSHVHVSIVPAARNDIRPWWSFPAQEQDDDMPKHPATMDSPAMGIVATPSGEGYWLWTSGGGVYSFGDADFKGSPLQKPPVPWPITGMAAHPDGDGYWLVASDGGVFSYGSAEFKGSLPGLADL